MSEYSEFVDRQMAIYKQDFRGVVEGILQEGFRPGQTIELTK